MNLLNDIITYIRRIIKAPSNASITDNLLIDYINRFYINDVPASIQLFDLKTKYQFQTTPGVDKYNMPLYSVQATDPTKDYTGPVGMYPVYQGFMEPAYINGIQVAFSTQKNSFFNAWPNVVQYQAVVGVGDGTAGPYTLNFPIGPNNTVPTNPPIQSLIRGHVDLTGIMALGINVDPPVEDTPGAVISIPKVPVTSVDSAVFITTIDATGANVVVQDSGQFLSGNVNYGLLMQPGKAPNGNRSLPGGYNSNATITGITQANPAVLTAVNTFVVGQEVTISGVVGMTELNGNTYEIIAVTPTTITIDVDSTLFTPYASGGLATTNGYNVVNYLTGVANVIFPVAIPSGHNINVQCFLFQSGLTRGILYYNNTLTLRSPPSSQFLVELDAYLSPAAFLNTSDAIPFGYMSEYIARGAARKILSDTGDNEQFIFYEPLFKEQETLVHIRSQRQFTATRTQTIYSQGMNQVQGMYNNNSFGGTLL